MSTSIYTDKINGTNTIQEYRLNNNDNLTIKSKTQTPYGDTKVEFNKSPGSAEEAAKLIFPDAKSITPDKSMMMSGQTAVIVETKSGEKLRVTHNYNCFGPSDKHAYVGKPVELPSIKGDIIDIGLPQKPQKGNLPIIPIKLEGLELDPKPNQKNDLKIVSEDFDKENGIRNIEFSRPPMGAREVAEKMFPDAKEIKGTMSMVSGQTAVVVETQNGDFYRVTHGFGCFGPPSKDAQIKKIDNPDKPFAEWDIQIGIKPSTVPPKTEKPTILNPFPKPTVIEPPKTIPNNNGLSKAQVNWMMDLIERMSNGHQISNAERALFNEIKSKMESNNPDSFYIK